MAVLAGGLAFVGSADATQIILDGSFENVSPTSSSIVKTGGKENPALGEGWSTFSTYLYSTEYSGPPVAGSGANFLRPYAGDANTPSSQTVTQLMSLVANTSLTASKIDAGNGRFALSAYFSTYLDQNDYSTLTLEFLDDTDTPVGEAIRALGGYDFIVGLPLVPSEFGKYPNSKEWGLDSETGTIPAGARRARVTIQSTSSGGLPDGYVDLVALDVTDATVSTPSLKSASPENNAIAVGPLVNLVVTLQDGSTTVNTNSIQLCLDNAPVSPVIAKTNDTVTLVRYDAGLLPALSQHDYQIVFGDSGSPAVTQTNRFHFTVADYLTLPAGLASPLGSEDTSKPGFEVRVWQVESPPVSDPPAEQDFAPPSLAFSEALLVGAVGPNVADLTGATGNAFTAQTINFATSAGALAGFPNDVGFPGIPGTLGTEDNFAHEVKTYIRFPAAGYYRLGVNNEDQFRLTAAEAGVQALRITAPTNMIIPSVVIATNLNELQFGGALPTTPLTGQLAYATPSGVPDDACAIGGNTALAGKIVLVDRGGACDSAAIAEQAQLAGAIAVIQTTPGDAGFPFRVTGSSTTVHIPVLIISDNYGGSLLKSYAASGTPVTLSIQGDPGPVVSVWDGYKSYGAVDVIAGFAVPAPGVYPFRLVSGQEQGPANLELFSIGQNGARVLINDSANATSLKAFRARTMLSQPVFQPVALSGGSLRLAWTGAGTLEETTALGGSWTTSPNQGNPQEVPIAGTMKYYRIRQ